MTADALPPVVDTATWESQLAALRTREKAATRELDAIAAERRRLPMVEMPDYTLDGEDGPVRLAELFDGKRQLIVYNHMWFAKQGMAVPRLHRVHLAVHPPGVPRQLRRPVRHRHPGPDRRGPRLQGARRQPDALVLDREQPLRHGRGRPAGRRLRRQRLPPRRRHRLPHLAHHRPRHRAAHPHLRPDRPPALRPPGGMAGLPIGWPQSPTYSGWAGSKDLAAIYGPNSG